LFGIAYYGDKRADIGRSIISNPYIYALSLAVYCTAWTFYGSVGRAASAGPAFLTIYLGPTLMATLGWLVLKKIIRISKIHRITSIADFIGSRYGKSMTLGGVVTVIAVLGIVPYISLQLKAISTSFILIHQYPSFKPLANPGGFEIWSDTTFYVALILAVFATFSARGISRPPNAMKVWLQPLPLNPSSNWWPLWQWEYS
jgi:Na+/proline symporter